jgi:hypothetical protein
MEQVMGGPYAESSIWGERRKNGGLRRRGGLTEMRKESDIRMG